MNLMTWLMISLSITLSTILVTTSTHWLMAWACLEINTLSMTPMISKPHHPRATEAATKYFLTQTLASMAMLLAATMNALNTSHWEITLMLDQTSTTIMTLALMMKMAAAPFHFWLPEVTQGTTTLTGLTILTWQKLAPMSLLIMISDKTNQTILLTTAILSITLGGLGGLNQTQLRKLLAFSSIAHTGWVLSTLTIAPNISTLTLSIYILTTIPIFIMLHSTSSSTIKDLGTMWTTTPQLTSALTLSILSLGGLPPLTGFMPKWLILNKMMFFNLTMEATLMAIMSLLSLYFYLRLTYISSMTLTPHTNTMTMKWRTNPKTKPLMASTLMIMSMLMLPMTPSL
ncbi:NADH dehydrogenase subunit 2 (mitochondrion) [Python bivittatus]|uniref:NADH-ubiquinone oxidoreductase chain 2 n=2 Tax=Python bivittatus TaxID=176946 RepID=R9UE79_PYTBI|nr:NADH dehydrogenase subunit 2 [Python bivittatus]AGN52905.1 NADH dehydrogenase subunit 2 [Python bivittatus]